MVSGRKRGNPMSKGVSEGRWLIKEYCGCRVTNPAKSRSKIPTSPSIRHCELHGGAFEMLCFIAEIYYSGDSRWRDKAESVSREIPRALHELRRRFTESFRERLPQVAAYYLDPERAVLQGRRNVDRTKTTCRLCEETFEDDEVAQLLHLRSSHWKEWRRLTRLK
jgi:hypothetical protein